MWKPWMGMCLLLLGSAGCGGAPQADREAVRNGNPNKTIVASVLMINSTDANVPADGFGSGAVVLYPGCVLTARHVATVAAANTMMVWQGATIDANSKGQLTGEVRARGSQTATKKMMDDIALMWMEDGGGPSWLHRADTTPLGVIDTIGMTSVDLSTGNESPGAKLVDIYGYGNNAGGVRTGTGSKTQRYGNPKAVQYVQANNPANTNPWAGSYYLLQLDANGIPANSIACEGDSGGPAMSGGKVFGVLSTSDAVTLGCGAALTATATGLDSGVTMPPKGDGTSNMKWLKKNATEMCGKKSAFNTMGNGKVVASLNGSIYSESTTPLINTLIDCRTGSPSSTDCEEEVHYGQSLSLTAIADSGWQFVGWTGPVDSTGSASTTLRFDAMYSNIGGGTSDTTAVTATFMPLCGSMGQVCCGGSGCNAGLVCSSGICTAMCGGQGQSCCNGTTCNPPYTCSAGICH